jgi:para-nitrobenzyl esterase
VPGEDVIAQTAAGRVRGARDGEALRFLGIPFAQSPATTGRFSSPERHRGWDGIRDALTYGGTSAQPDRGVTFIPEPIIAGDNELNLNVYTPDLGAAGLPVLVWIHGGGYFGGCNASPWYQGRSFARDGVVLVSINYRLGAQGFLELPDAPANRAVRDWLLALQWVRDNIASFGGDPAKVTIGGQSAGGGACAALLGAPAARGLFRGAICMSGGASLQQTAAGVRSVAEQLTRELGVPLRKDALDGLTTGTILAAQDAVMARRAGGPDPESVGAALRGMRLPWAPWVDGDIVTEDPWQAAGCADRGVSMLIGATAHEFNLGWLQQRWVTADMVRTGLARAGVQEDRLEAYLNQHRGRSAAEIVGQGVTDRTIRVPAQELAAAMATGQAAAYVYDFRWPSPVESLHGQACHCLDIPFAFDGLAEPGVREVAGDAPPATLASLVHGAWVRFVTDGHPGWDRYDTARRPVMIFGERAETRADPLRLERETWSDIRHVPDPGREAVLTDERR